jgi:hypothetical protein
MVMLNVIVQKGWERIGVKILGNNGEKQKAAYPREYAKVTTFWPGTHGFNTVGRKSSISDVKH